MDQKKTERAHRGRRGFLVAGITTGTGLLLDGCGTPPGGRADLDGPVFGPSGATVTEEYAVGPDGVSTKVAAKIAKVTRRYRRLNRSEQDLVRELARRKLATFVAAERKRVRKVYAKRRDAAATRTKQQSQKLRGKISNAQNAGKVKEAQNLADELVRAEAAGKNEVARIDAAEEKAVANPWGGLDIGASGSTAQKSGIGFVIENAEKKPVVALVDISAGGTIANVDAFAYEIDQFGSQDQLVAAVRSKSRSVVVDNNRKNYLITGTVENR